MRIPYPAGHIPCFLLALFALAACNGKDSGSPNDPPSASAPAASGPAAGGARNRPQVVSTTFSRVTNVPVVLAAQGNVLSLDEVEVRAQRTGTVAQVHFREGQEVRRGQLLFSLDDREDAAAARRAEAALAGAQAQMDIAQRDLQRTQDLSSRNFVSSSALDVARNKVDAARASLQQQQAALEEARVALSYSRITAPFEGRAGRIDVRTGSLVTTATPMVKITRMNPIGVSFTLPERELAGLLAAQQKRPVRVQIETGNTQASGEVSFIDSSVDAVAGTIAVKARVANDTRGLWPGQFVNVKITAGELRDVVVLPAQAIINGPSSRFVYEVKDDMSVAQREVQVQRIVDGQAVVTGLPGGVKVVLEGGQNLRPGGKIQEARPSSGNGGQRGRRNGGDASSPASADAGPASRPAGDPPRRASSRTDQPPAANTGNSRTPTPPAGPSGAVLPEGFTPRDPEAFAKLSDAEKAERIQRWRERRDNQGQQR